MSKELELYKELINIVDVPTKSDLLNRKDPETLARYRYLRTEIEEVLKRTEPVIPFDIEFVDLEPSIGTCICGASVLGGQHYCDICGQKLDWEIDCE